MGWRLATVGLYRAAAAVCPAMVARGKGTFLVTSATAAVRGNAGQHSHAAAMGGRRMLCQSLNAEFASKGIHVAHPIIDGAIDTEWIAENFPERYALKDQGGILNPDHIADAYWMLHCQPKDAWTHELDLRPWMEIF